MKLSLATIALIASAQGLRIRGEGYDEGAAAPTTLQTEVVSSAAAETSPCTTDSAAPEVTGEPEAPAPEEESPEGEEPAPPAGGDGSYGEEGTY